MPRRLYWRPELARLEKIFIYLFTVLFVFSRFQTQGVVLCALVLSFGFPSVRYPLGIAAVATRNVPVTCFKIVKRPVGPPFLPFLRIVAVVFLHETNSFLTTHLRY